MAAGTRIAWAAALATFCRRCRHGRPRWTSGAAGQSPAPGAGASYLRCPTTPTRTPISVAAAFVSLDEVNERAERCGHKPPSRIVEERTGEALPPRFEDGLQRAAVEMRAQPVLEMMHDPDAGDRRVDREVARPADADEQRSGGIDAHNLAATLELPGRHRPATKAATQAGVVKKIARMHGPAAAIEICGSGGRCEALNAGGPIGTAIMSCSNRSP